MNTETLSEQPLYKRIQEGIRQRIMSGEWPHNSMLPSRRELCIEFKTTQVTLDKAIQELIRDGVLRASRGSGTFVGSTSKARKAHRIGVVVRRESLEEHWDNNHYFGPLFGGMREAMMSSSVEVLYANIEQTDYIRYFNDMQLDGMIIVLPSLNDVKTLHHIADQGVPFVAVGFSTTNPDDARLKCIDCDNRGGVKLALEHLVSLGHNDIGMINLAISQSNHYDRYEAFNQVSAD